MILQAIHLLYKRTCLVASRLISIAKMRLIVYTASALSVVLTQFILLLTWSMSFLCLLAAATVWFIGYSHNTALGLLLAATALIVVFALALLFQKSWISRPIADAIIRNMD